ncbi:MAG: DUF945 family protein [Thiotrichaceae bacterium]|nr:DUF945 family protein [Thiotrichaceae bacterium]
MKKVLQLTAVTLLLSSFPLIAQINTPILSDDAIHFNVQHRFNGGEPLPTEMITIPFNVNPLIPLKENFCRHLKKKNRPAKIDTILEWVLPESETQVLGYLPPVSIKTNIDCKGVGKSDLIFPAYRRQVPKQFGRGVIDWKGLDAHFTFLKKFEDLTAAVNIAGFILKEEDGILAKLGKSTFHGQFDSTMTPTQMAGHISTFNLSEQEYYMNLNNLEFKFNTEKSAKGLDLGNFSVKVGPIDLNDEDFASSMTALVLKAGSNVQDGLVNSTLYTQINNWILPTPVLFDTVPTVNFVGDIAIRNLDEDVLLAVRKMVTTENSENIMNMFGETMAILPQLLTKSPEINLSNFLLETPNGNLKVSASIKIDGKKVTSLEESVLRAALQANLDVLINQKLLEEILAIQILTQMLEEHVTDEQKFTESELNFLKQQAKNSSKEQISMLISLGLFVTAKDDYKLDADFKNNQLILNGKIIPLPF